MPGAMQPSPIVPRRAVGPLPAGDPRPSRALDAAAERLVDRVQAELGDALPLACVITDPRRPDNPIVYVNAAFEAITGYAAADALGRNCRFLQGPEREQAAVDDLRAAIERAEPVTVELRNRRRDGSSFVNRLLVTPMLDEAGRPFAFMGIQYEVDGF